MLRGELLRHLIALEGQTDGRAIVDQFVARMEGLLAGVGVRNPTLFRYTLSQLCILRHELARRDEMEGRRDRDGA